MPYKQIGKCVYQKKESGWVKLRCYNTVAKAKAYFWALKKNVEEKENG